MAKHQALKEQTPATAPPSISATGPSTISNIIRETMERSTALRPCPGYGGMLMGVTAVAAAYIANGQVYLRDSLITWIVEAFLAFAIGFLAMWQKSKIAGMPLISTPAKKFALSFLPPLVCGIVITLGLMAERILLRNAARFYAVLRGGGRLRRGILGTRGSRSWAGVLLRWERPRLLMPTGYGNLMMAASFGLLHIVFGAVIGRRYGG